MRVKALKDLLTKHTDDNAVVYVDGIEVVGIDVVTRHNADGEIELVELLLDDAEEDCD